MGNRAQALINERVLAYSELMVGIFWSRLGTPTGGCPSGSVEEIQRHMSAGKPAMLYFSEARVPEDVDAEQLAALQQFRHWCHRSHRSREPRAANRSTARCHIVLAHKPRDPLHPQKNPKPLPRRF